MYRPATFLLVLFALLTGQLRAIVVHGIVRDAFTRLPLSETRVSVSDEGGLVTERITRLDGFYRVDLVAGHSYLLRFELQGYVPRSVVFDASQVPRRWEDDLSNILDLRLFPPLMGMDSVLLNTPIGSARWDAEDQQMLWDMEHSDPLIAQWNLLLDEHLKRHPENRPTVFERSSLWLFDHIHLWSWPFFIVAVWCFHKLIGAILRPRGRWARRFLLIGTVVVLAIACSHWPSPGSPLRSGILLIFILCLYALARTIVEFLFDPTAEDRSDVVDEDEDEEFEEVFTPEQIAIREAETELIKEQELRADRKNTRSAVLFVASMFIFSFELRHIENTLNSWSLVWISGVAALILTALIRLLTRRNYSHERRTRSWFLSGTWWLVLPLLSISGTSFINRHFPNGKDNCQNWPIDRVSTIGSSTISVSWAGKTKEFALPVEEIERMGKHDSLRCCYRTGALGYDHIFSIEPVALTE